MKKTKRFLAVVLCMLLMLTPLADSTGSRTADC